jgi:hypothetical protein
MRGQAQRGVRLDFVGRNEGSGSTRGQAQRGVRLDFVDIPSADSSILQLELWLYPSDNNKGNVRSWRRSTYWGAGLTLLTFPLCPASASSSQSLANQSNLFCCTWARQETVIEARTQLVERCATRGQA